MNFKDLKQTIIDFFLDKWKRTKDFFQDVWGFCFGSRKQYRYGEEPNSTGGPATPSTAKLPVEASVEKSRPVASTASAMAASLESAPANGATSLGSASAPAKPVASTASAMAASLESAPANGATSSTAPVASTASAPAPAKASSSLGSAPAKPVASLGSAPAKAEELTEAEVAAVEAEEGLLKSSGSGVLQDQLQRRLGNLDVSKKEEPLKKVQSEDDSLPPPPIDPSNLGAISWEERQFRKIDQKIKELKSFLVPANQEDCNIESNSSKFRRLSRELIELLFGESSLSDVEMQFKGGLIYKNESGDIVVKRKNNDENFVNFRKNMNLLIGILENESADDNAKIEQLEKGIEYFRSLKSDQQKIGQNLTSTNSTFITSACQILEELSKMSFTLARVGGAVGSPQANNFTLKPSQKRRL